MALSLKARAVGLFRLTRAEYFTDFLITPPLTLLLIVLSLRAGVSPLWPVQFAIGWLAWTFYEYALHRWVSHRLWFFRDVHQLHHARQLDYVAVPPVATLALYALLWLTFGAGSGALMCGFSAGYVLYSALHTAFHYAAIGAGHPLFAAKRRHALHHKFENSHFGVTTGLWDWLLGTGETRTAARR